MLRNNKEKEQKKQLLHGLENLTDLGGFIQERIEDELYELYPSNVVNTTMKYWSIGPGFWDVADAIENAFHQTTRYADDAYVDEDFDELIPYPAHEDPEFNEWLVDQVARIVAENIRDKKSSFWNGWEFSGDTRRALRTLNALDERVLILLNGVDDGQKLTAKQISELPEFACSEEYINKVIAAINNTLYGCDRGNEELCKFVIHKEQERREI